MSSFDDRKRKRSDPSSGSTMIKGRWVLKQRVGKGTFCDLHLGRSVYLNESDLCKQVAIKIQTDDIASNSNVVRTEGELLKGLSAAGLETVPKYITSGSHEGRPYMVMELLGGEDMAHLRDRIRLSVGIRVISLPGAVYLSRQMLRCIKGIHKSGYIHRDIKPANFIRRDQNSTEFVMIDFGVTKKYLDDSGSIRPQRENCEFRGTTQYASPFAHGGYDQCPRDDLLGMVLVFCDLVCGKLPWSENAKNKDKASVISRKQEFFDDVAKYMNWIHETANSEMMKFSDENDRFDNFPINAQSACTKIIMHLMALKYEDKPDYGLIDTLFDNMLEGEFQQNVHAPDFTYRGFSWAGGIGKKTLESEPLTMESNEMQNIIHARVQHLNKLIREYNSKMNNDKCDEKGKSIQSNETESNLYLLEIVYSYSNVLLRDIMGLLQSKQLRFENLENIFELLRKYEMFTNVLSQEDIGNDDSMKLYRQLQKSIYRLNEIKLRFDEQFGDVLM